MNTLQNPMHVAFMKALQVHAEVSEDFGFTSLRDPKLHNVTYTYKEDWDVFVFSDECLSDYDMSLQILPECLLYPGCPDSQRCPL